MGCDIHLSVEKFVDGKWCPVENPMRKCWACEGTGKSDEYKEPFEVYDSGCDPITNKEFKVATVLPAGTCVRCRGAGKRQAAFYDGRNYQLFAILAGVRDYGKVVPIAKPRGVPEDLSAEVREDVDGYGPDAHGASWYTLKELLDWNWEATAGFCAGVIGLEQFKEFLKTQKPPDGYSQGVGGPNVIVADSGWLAHEILLEQKNPGCHLRAGFDYYTRIKWPESYKDMAGESFLAMLEELKQYADQSPFPILHKHVRLFFYFDN
jgi:hypothetical protein